jgi:integrase
MTIRRNYTKLGDFTLPKTEAGTDRVVHLIKPAIDALRNQAEMTRLGRQYQVEVQLREYGRTVIHDCTFVFNPQLVKKVAAWVTCTKPIQLVTHGMRRLNGQV